MSWTLSMRFLCIAMVGGITMAASSRRKVSMVGVLLSLARTRSCAMSVGQSSLTSTWHVVMLGQMMNRLFGKLVELLAVKLRLPIPLSLVEKPVFQGPPILRMPTWGIVGSFFERLMIPTTQLWSMTRGSCSQ